MKKLIFASAVVFVALIGSVVISCKPKEKAPEQKTEQSSVPQTETTTPEVTTPEVTSDVQETKQDPFSNSKYSNANYLFNGAEIDGYIIKVSFNKENVPAYEFAKKGNGWAAKDTSKNEYFYDGSDDENKAQGFKIHPANFYRYNGYNPLTQKKGGDMERFRFYAMLHSKASVADLNNYLVAIDTYSKFVFAYAKVSETKSLVGHKVPTAFDAVENYHDKKKFYEYDPIGAVKMEGGNLVMHLYDEYKKEIAESAVEYFPKVHDANRATATSDASGTSPYFVKK